jgi:hypothetical protein
MPDINIGTSMPSRYVPRPRTYSNITFDASTGLVIAAATLANKFALFDEDGNRMWEPDGKWGTHSGARPNILCDFSYHSTKRGLSNIRNINPRTMDR